MRRSFTLVWAFAASLGAVAAHAQGSSLDQHSACMSARMGAGIARPCADASAVYFSPAALAFQPSAIGLGVTVVRSSNEFFYNRNIAPSVERETETVPVPHGFASLRLGERLAAGIGLYAPYGLGLKWPEEFEGRFVGYDNSLRSFYVQPTLAFQAIPNRLSVGAGVAYVHSTIEIHRRQDLAEQVAVRNPATGAPIARFGNLGIPSGTDFADVTLAGDGNSLTFQVGAVLQANERVSLGVRYLHEATVELEGDADFEPYPTGLVLGPSNPFGAPAGTRVEDLPPLAAQFRANGLLVDRPLASEITFPSQLVVGASIQATPALRLFGDYQRTGWSSFDQLDIDFGAVSGEPTQQDTLLDQALVLDYQDTNTFRLGAEFGLSDAVMLRGGFRYNTEATPTATPLLAEYERNYYSVGLGLRPGARLGLDLSYQYVNQADREGRVRSTGPNVGLYTSTGHVFGATLSYRFGSMMQP